MEHLFTTLHIMAEKLSEELFEIAHTRVLTTQETLILGSLTAQFGVIAVLTSESHTEDCINRPGYSLGVSIAEDITCHLWK